MCGYEFQEYENQTENLRNVSGVEEICLLLIIRLTSACLDSMKTLGNLHKHNFDLRRIVKRGGAALDGIMTDFSYSQDE